MYAELSTIKDYLKGINFHTNEHRKKHTYLFQLFNHLFAITYIVFIALSLFAVVASIIIFILGIDLRVLINDSQLTKILAIYISSIILISAIVSLKNTFSKMKQIELKNYMHKYVWCVFLFVHVAYALVVFIVLFNL